MKKLLFIFAWICVILCWISAALNIIFLMFWFAILALILFCCLLYYKGE